MNIALNTQTASEYNWSAVESMITDSIRISIHGYAALELDI